MGTPGSGRKRAPIKDRFSAEDEALGSIAREAEARLAAKRAARAEARDIRMRELERQQKEAVDDDVMPVRSVGSYRSSSYSASYGVTSTPVSSNSRKDLLSSSLYSDPLATTPKSYRASLCDDGLYGSYSSLRAPSEYSYSSSSRASSTRSSPMSSDDDTTSTVSQDRASRGRRDSVSSDFSDISESAADYFSRANRRGSIVSDLDDLSIPDLDSLDDKSDKHFTDSFTRPVSRNAVPGLSAAALASLGGTSSRRGSGDTGSIVDPDASLSELRDIYDLKDQIQDVEGRYMQGLKELKDSLTEVEEKYKKAMVSNAQLDNEKANLIYQVDTLKDVIEEMEELMAEMHRETEDKSKELERQKHTCNVLQHKIEELKEGVRQRDELIEALERQKEYFDCIRNERDELRDELAVLNGKMKTGEPAISNLARRYNQTLSMTGHELGDQESKHLPKIDKSFCSIFVMSIVNQHNKKCKTASALKQLAIFRSRLVNFIQI
ncbi:Leucine-rich repeat flightless-interacting protein 2 [Acipenser ruthenus]|uniref:Leucine-rich repeat flightless-interacting protein 2 n=1 Tax=Acipenser ruthenus TaxID=7906 RepID=A0A444UK96_ACIRT|nr:Leucine-rich repeat flightless-interacting protein 2 [Acipenser ruthenus]